MANPLHFHEVPEEQIRAWADDGMISSARYVEEVERRRRFSHAREQIAVVPPLDYAVTDDDLAIELAFDDFERGIVDDLTMPFDAAPLLSGNERAALVAIGAIGFVLLAIAMGLA